MMTRCFSGRAAVAVVLGMFTLASGVEAQETEIKLDQVPKVVMDSAKAKFPGAKMREASKEIEDGKTVFELSLIHENRKMDVTFQEDGTLVVVETVVPAKELPAAVMQAVKDRYPGAKINLVESVKKGPRLKQQADYYELHLTRSDKKSAEVEVDASGKILKTEEKQAKENDEDEEKERN
jgi:uncharacterized membrane protein YkoI